MDGHDRDDKSEPADLSLHETGMSHERIHTLRLLHRIAKALDQPIEHFFSSKPRGTNDPDGSSGLKNN